MSRVKKTRGLGDNIHRVQQDAEQSFNAIVPDWIRNGKMLKGVSLVPGTPQKVAHGLGHRHQGWLVMSPRQTNDPRVSEAGTQGNDTTAIVLSSVSAVVVDLWVW